jgi:hypothetical protein
MMAIGRRFYHNIAALQPVLKMEKGYLSARGGVDITLIRIATYLTDKTLSYCHSFGIPLASWILLFFGPIRCLANYDLSLPMCNSIYFVFILRVIII